MGSPLGSILANLFHLYREENWLNNCLIEFKPTYRSYVDDIFVLFELHEPAHWFCEYIFSKRQNINYKMKILADSHFSMS